MVGCAKVGGRLDNGGKKLGNGIRKAKLKTQDEEDRRTDRRTDGQCWGSVPEELGVRGSVGL